MTSTLIILDQTKTICSDVPLGYDLTKLTTLINPTFKWEVTENANVKGENSNNGTLINDVLVNTSGSIQTIKYTITPFNNKGCQGPDFELVITLNPEPYIVVTPSDITCSNIALNHNLNNDINFTGTSFKWAAIDNPNVSGETTAITNSTSITDKLINKSGQIQTIVYQITPESTNGCIGKQYNYTVTLRPEAKLVVSKITIPAIDGAYDSVGEVIQYQITVENTNEVDLNNLTLTNSNADPNSVTPSNVSSIAAFTKVTFVAEHTITQADLNIGLVSNSATADALDPCGTAVIAISDDPNTTTANDNTVTNLVQKPLLTLAKSAVFNDTNNDGLAQKGETITYSFEVINKGNITVSGITITDALVATNGSPITLNPTQMDSTTFTATYTLTQSDVDAGKVTNSATASGVDSKGNIVSAISDDPNNATNQDSDNDGQPDDATVTTLKGESLININKTGTFNDANNDGFANIGETITYAFEVTNIGNHTLSNITVNDALTPVEGSILSLTPNQKDSTTFKASYIITQADIDAGKITNTATVSAQNPNDDTIQDVSDDPTDPTNSDPNNDGNPDDATITTYPVESKISLVKTALGATDGAYDTIGEKIQYTLVVTNTGSTTLSNVIITDVNADSGSINPNTITVLNPGQVITTTATHTVNQLDLDAGSVSNSANVASIDPLGNTISDTSDDPTNNTNFDTNGDGNPDDITLTSMIQTPKMALTKTASLAPDGLWNEVGEQIFYTLELTNTGNVTLTNIVITDNNADTGSIAPANFVTLAPGQKVVSQAIHTITQNDLDKGAVTNSAIVNAIDPKGNAISDASDDPTNPTDADLNGDGNPDDATVTATPQLATMDVTKTTSTTTFTNIGDVMQYTIVVTNTGNINLLDVTIEDNNASFTSAATKSTLAPSQYYTITAQHIITADDIAFGYVNNTVIAHAKIPYSTIVVSEDSDDPNNATNIDIDNDGDYEDPTTSYLDTDSDGIADIIDVDDDNDGITDIVEGNTDSDGDGLPNSLDIDADNDGIPDNVEGQPTNTYKAPSGIDANKNGLDDIYETASLIGLYPVNTDGTDNPDYLDSDSDNDGIPDTIEAFDYNKDGIADISQSGKDEDHDGLDDSFEGTNTMDGFIVNNEMTNGSIDTQNSDETDQPDYRDTDDDNDGVLTKYELDPNKDGKGPDDTDKDGVPDYLDIDDDGDGVTTRKEGADPNGDGNPDDAIDANNNNIPDYLEVGNSDPTIPEDEIEVYNAVTPDGDGNNDSLVLGRIYLFPENTVEIYNRWGVLVYETDSYGTRGNFFKGISEGRITVNRNEKLPGGTYYYIIKYKSGENYKSKAGYLYLRQ